MVILLSNCFNTKTEHQIHGVNPKIKCIRFSLINKHKNSITCPYCGCHVRKYGFFKKAIFEPLKKNFKVYLIQRVQCTNDSCAYKLNNKNAQGFVFGVYPSTIVPFISITSSDLNTVISYEKAVKSKQTSTSKIDLSIQEHQNILSTLSDNLGQHPFVLEKIITVLNNFKENLFTKALELNNYIIDTIIKANESSYGYYQALIDTPTPHATIQKIPITKNESLTSLVSKLLNKAVTKISTCDFFKRGFFFRKLTLPTAMVYLKKECLS